MTHLPPNPEDDRSRPGGVVHTYLGFDPVRFPPPAQPSIDVAGAAMEHMLAHGGGRPISPQELARAVRIDPSMIKGFGPSLESIIRRLEERRDALLRTYELTSARRTSDERVTKAAKRIVPPEALRGAFDREMRGRQLRGLERLWYRAERDHPEFAAQLPALTELLAQLFAIDRTLSRFTFTGRTAVTPDEAVQIGDELESIERLLEQLREAMKNAQLAVIDMDELASMLEEAEIQPLRDLAERIREMVEQAARDQGMEQQPGGLSVTPRAMRLYQSRVLREIFAALKASRSGRHDAQPEGEGATESARTRPWEFGDGAAQIEPVESVLNAFARRAIDDVRAGDPSSASDAPMMTARDLVVRRTISRPRCATSLIVDMSGSMRWSGLYVQCKRMALALDGLVRRDYPGDFLNIIEMASFARPCTAGEMAGLMPKPVTIRHPVVRLVADMADPGISELDVPPHFTNIQHALVLARRFLSVQDTPNRQIMLITDGLPTAHFEGSRLFLLYPPQPRTEEATLREAAICAREGITINIFLLPTWSQSSEDVQFAHRIAETARGRVFFVGGSDLDRFVVWDYVSMRRKIM